MRKLVNTATAACGVALTIGMLAGGTAAAATPTPSPGSPGHGHTGTHGGHSGAHGGTTHRPGGGHRGTGGGSADPGSAGGHQPGHHGGTPGHPGGHSGGNGGNHSGNHGGNHSGGHSGGHAGGHSGHPGGHHGHRPGTPGGDQPGANQPGGGTPGGDQPGGGTPGADEPSSDAPAGDQPGGDAPAGDQPGGVPPGSATPAGSQNPRAADPHIVGGKPATAAPWAAQIEWTKGGFTCSGTVIDPQWVLTPRHCVGQEDMSVKVGSTTLGAGENAAVDRAVTDDDGDLALLHLDHAVRSAPAKLATTAPKPKSPNMIYGFGATAPNSPPSQELRSARVKVTGTNCMDAFNGPAICSTKVDGSAYFGDSGGAEMANGELVGVCSAGDGDTQQYASVAAARQWITKVIQV